MTDQKLSVELFLPLSVLLEIQWHIYLSLTLHLTHATIF